MKKLLVVVPCYNEEQHLGNLLRAIPRKISQCASVEILVVDDGSRDRSVQVALRSGADHVLELGHNRGLAAVFREGLEAALALGADAVAVLDADGQYPPDEIGLIVGPVLEGRADICVGSRPIASHPDFSFVKKCLQRLGSGVVSVLCRQRIEDAVSGFRAYSREALLRLQVMNSYTYTVETLIQAAYQGLRIVQVPISVAPTTRPSRLVRSVLNYVTRMAAIMLRTTTTYYPLSVFTVLSLLTLVPGVGLGGRFLSAWSQGVGQGHVQSLILCALLILISFLLLCMGLLADLISANRRLLQESLYREKVRSLMNGTGRQQLQKRFVLHQPKATRGQPALEPLQVG